MQHEEEEHVNLIPLLRRPLILRLLHRARAVLRKVYGCAKCRTHLCTEGNVLSKNFQTVSGRLVDVVASTALQLQRVASPVESSAAHN